MQTAKTDLEIKLYNVLKKIAYDYAEPETMLEEGEELYGLPGEEILSMAYDNIRADAANAIRDIRVKTI